MNLRHTLRPAPLVAALLTAFGLHCAQAGITQNGFNPNGITTNGVTSNSVNPNGVTSNGQDNGHTTHGLGVPQRPGMTIGTPKRPGMTRGIDFLARVPPPPPGVVAVQLPSGVLLSVE